MLKQRRSCLHLRNSKLIGRESLIKELENKIFSTKQKKLTIIPVEGPGGIGKTTLIENAISLEKLTENKFLFLSLDGRTPGSNILTKLNNIINKALTEQLPNNSEPYFSLTQKLDAIKKITDKEIYEKISDTLVSDEQKEALKSMLDLGTQFFKFIPDIPGLSLPKNIKTKEIEELIDKVNTCSENLKLKSGILTSMIKFLSAESVMKDGMLRDFEDYVADNFYVDLVCILNGWRKTEKKKIRHYLPNKCKNFETLFLYIDDFESYQNNVGLTFFFEKLLPKLESKSPFKTVLLISTRDEISSNNDWTHKYGAMLDQNKIQLTPLTKKETQEVIESKKNNDIDLEDIFNETEGIPLLIDLYLKEKHMGGPSAHYLKQFYDRQTQWMEKHQKIWLNKLCYLDSINLNTIPCVLEDDPKIVLEWFQKEGSIRDTRTATFQIRSFIKTRILNYLNLISPVEHNEILRKLAGRN